MRRDILDELDFDPLSDSNNEVLAIPANANAGWCFLVNCYYAVKGYRTCLRTESYLLPKVTADGQAVPDAYYTKTLRDFDGRAARHQVLGTFVGLDFRPDFRSNPEEPLRYIPFAQLAPAEDIVSGETLAGDSRRPILIPLEEGQIINLKIV